MALTFKIDKVAEQESADSFVLQDNTVYGSPNALRNARANFLFVTKTDKDGNRTLEAITPNTSNPITVGSWTVISTLDGWIEKIIFSLELYSNVKAYATNELMYNSLVDNKIYKRVTPGTGNAAPNPTYWIEVPVANLYTNEIDNALIDGEIIDDLVTARVQDKIKDAYSIYADKFLANLAPIEQYTEADFLDGLLQAAYSDMLNGRPEAAEEIIRGIFTYYLNAA